MKSHVTSVKRNGQRIEQKSEWMIEWVTELIEWEWNGWHTGHNSVLVK